MSVQQDAITQGAAFFTPAANTKPYLKVAAQGFAGTGKTYTLFKIALNVLAKVREHDPATSNRIVFFDTEKASGFLRPLAEKAGVDLMVRESRSLKDLVEAINICDAGYASVMMIDSVSHVYEGFVEAFKAEKKRSRLEIQDWGVLKPMWKSKFSDRFVRSRVHILFTGRAGYEYEAVEVERDNGTKKKEFHKAGIKMKVDGETAYEPDVLIEMARFEELGEDFKSKTVKRTATILKDRSGLIDGKVFVNPTGDEFTPVIDYLLTGPSAGVAAPEGDDRALFDESDEAEAAKLERTIVLEEVEGLIVQLAPGQTTKEKELKVQLLIDAFGTRSWKAVCVHRLDHLRRGKAILEQRLVAHQAASRANAKEGLDPPDPLAGGAALDRRTGNTEVTDATAARGNGAEGKDAPGTDAPVAVVKPLSDIERARMRKQLATLLGKRDLDSYQGGVLLTKKAGREITGPFDLTDAELQTIHAELSTS